MAEAPNLKQLNDLISEYVGIKKKEVRQLPLWEKKFDFPSLSELIGIKTTNKLWNWKGLLSGKDKPIAPTTEDLQQFLSTIGAATAMGSTLGGPIGISRREAAKQFVQGVKAWNRSVRGVREVTKRKGRLNLVRRAIPIPKAKEALKAFSKAPRGFYDPIEEIKVKSLPGAKATHTPGKRYEYFGLSPISEMGTKGDITLDPEAGLAPESILHEGVHGRQYQAKTAEGVAELEGDKEDLMRRAMTISDKAYRARGQNPDLARQIWSAIPTERQANFLAKWIMNYPEYMGMEEGKIPTAEEFRQVFWDTLRLETETTGALEDLGIDLGQAKLPLKETK